MDADELRFCPDGLLTDAALLPDDDGRPMDEPAERDGPEERLMDEPPPECDIPPPPECDTPPPRLTDEDARPPPPPPLDCANDVSGTSANAAASVATSVIL